MKIIEATEKFLARWPKGHRVRKGACCGHAVVPGQWVVVHDRQLPGVSLDSTTLTHVSCLRDRFEDVPEDDVEPRSPAAAFRRERRLMIQRSAA